MGHICSSLQGVHYGYIDLLANGAVSLWGFHKCSLPEAQVSKDKNCLCSTFSHACRAKQKSQSVKAHAWDA